MHKAVGIVLVGLSATLAACGGGDGGEDSSNLVYRSLESKQCQGGGKTLAEVQAVLAGAGVQVQSASCGVDGLVRAAVCGEADGRIAIFEVPPAQVPTALAAGFPSASGIPYQRTPC